MSGVRVHAFKPPLPTLWLDSSVGIKLAKIERGEVGEPEATPLKALKELIIDFTLRRKLLCVQSEQDDEYPGLRLDDEVFEQFNRLSLGIRLAAAASIKDGHSFAAMKALVGGESEVVLPYDLSFHRDPVEELKEIEGVGYFIVVGPPGSPLSAERRTRSKQEAELFEKWCQENVRKCRTFEEQLADELKADANAFMKRASFLGLRVITEGPSAEVLGEILDLNQARQLRKEAGGKPEGDEGLVAFYSSPIFAALPLNRIASVLFADLLTGNEVIRSGDPGDVRLLSVAIPIPHFVVTDIKMERRIKKRKVDAEWDTKVYSMRTLDTLMQDLHSWGVDLRFAHLHPAAPAPVIVQRIHRTSSGQVSHRFSLCCPRCGAWFPSFRPVPLRPLDPVIAEMASPRGFFTDRTSPGALRLGNL